MSVSWPSTLPVPQRDSFAIAAGDTNLRSDGDGKIDVRHRQDEIICATELNFKMTQAQYALFQAFWIYEAAKGSAWISGMTMHDGVRSVRPIKAYAAKLLGNLWNVTLPVEWEL